jgi:hypothetical protein
VAALLTRSPVTREALLRASPSLGLNLCRCVAAPDESLVKSSLACLSTLLDVAPEVRAGPTTSWRNSPGGRAAGAVQ